MDRRLVLALRIAVIGFVGLATGSAFAAPIADGEDQPLTVAEEAAAAYTAGDYAVAAPLFLEAAFLAPSEALGLYYNAACSFALLGQEQLAFRYLQAAVDHGYRSLEWMLSDSDLQSLHESPDWVRITEEIRSRVSAASNPAKVNLVTDDIDRFWRVVDLIESKTSGFSPEELLDHLYFGPGTKGLQDFVAARIGSATKLAESLESYADYYDSIRANSLAIQDQAVEIRAAMAKMLEFVPEATFPDVYFVVGRFTSAGTVSSNGLLIGVEMLTQSVDSPLEVLPAPKQKVVRSASVLPWVVAHELVHSLQSPPPNTTLLAAALREGGADFVAELAAGPPVPLPFYRGFVDSHELWVWQQFEKEMGESDTERWIGNNSRGTEEWPADLGYEIGYRIAKAYYDQSSDRKQAVRELLQLEEPMTILQVSGYAGGE